MSTPTSSDVSVPVPAIVIKGAESAYSVLGAYSLLPQIHVIVGCVDGRSQLFSLGVLHIGAEEEYVISPKLIHIYSLEKKAFAYFVGISHPWGDAVPTPTDIQNARQLNEYCLKVDSPLMDVITFGVDDYVSLKEGEIF